jgi:hypothetical protein
MKRPIGVTLLALGAGLIGIYQLYRMLIFLGIASFDFGLGKGVSFPEPQWGQAFWALVLAAIWLYEAKGFWDVRAYAWSFGIFIAVFTLIWGFFALISGSSYEAETVPWLLALLIMLYLQYPGVREHFMQNELQRMTPAQRAAYEQVAAANAAAMAANAAASNPAAAAAPTAPAPAAPAPAAPAPAAPAAPAAPDDQAPPSA